MQSGILSNGCSFQHNPTTWLQAGLLLKSDQILDREQFVGPRRNYFSPFSTSAGLARGRAAKGRSTVTPVGRRQPNRKDNSSSLLDQFPARFKGMILRDSMEITRVGIFHSSRSILGSKSGGAGVYEASLAELFDQIAREMPIEFVHYVPGASRFRNRKLDQPNRIIREFRSGFWEQLLSRSPHSLAASWVEKMGLLKTRNRLRREAINLVYFTSPSPIALRIADLPYVITIWDLGHRELPGFPEVWRRSTWLDREKIYSIGCGRASFVVVDSESTGEKLGKLFGVPAERWGAIGLLSHSLETGVGGPKLEQPYIFYPAIQWPHKNHVTLFEAHAALLKQFPNLRLVLSGEERKTNNGLDRLAIRLGSSRNIVTLGFISRNNLFSILRDSAALVMPSLLGPTNIPPLEALQLGVPTIVSDRHDYGDEINKMMIRVPSLDTRAWVDALTKVLEANSRQDPVAFSSVRAVGVLREIFANLICEVTLLRKFKG